ncbi:MAG: hypothetical protein ACLSAH_09315 [Bilophila wadsworthia]
MIAHGMAGCWWSGWKNDAAGGLKRAYAELNDFEEQLQEHNNILLKFWLHISRTSNCGGSRSGKRSRGKL